MTAANRRLDELRVRREARNRDRTAFEERRQFGLGARHAAKLAYLAARKEQSVPADDSIPEEAVSPAPEQAIPPPPGEQAWPSEGVPPSPEVA